MSSSNTHISSTGPDHAGIRMAWARILEVKNAVAWYVHRIIHSKMTVDGPMILEQPDFENANIRTASKGKWAVFDCRPTDDGVHVGPLDDWVDHQLTTRCICRPKVEFHEGGMVVVHDAADGRK